VHARSHVTAGVEARIVSLVPGVTESLLAWGVEPVGVTRFCEQPTYEAVGGTKDPDVARIVALRPDLVVVEKEENRREDADALVAAGIALHVLHVTTVEDVAPQLRDLRTALDLPPVEDEEPLPAPRTGSSRALVPIWRRPWMALGRDTYGSSLLRWLGVETVPAVDRYPTIDDLADVDCDVVLAPSEPYPFAERHRAELEGSGAPVVFVDGQDLFWWGVRTPAAMRRLAASVAP
jgi:ABC-type Fe3+-hydroxamate transport system substrate-binding protein